MTTAQDAIDAVITQIKMEDFSPTWVVTLNTRAWAQLAKNKNLVRRLTGKPSITITKLKL